MAAPFTRLVRFFPAWDKRHPDAAQNYGIHGAEIVMGLTHPKGAVTFSLYTNWMLPAVRAEQDARLTDEVRRAVRAELAGEIIALLKTGRTVRTDATGQHASDAVLALLVGTERAWQSDPRAAFFDLAQSPFTLLHPLPADLGYH